VNPQRRTPAIAAPNQDETTAAHAAPVARGAARLLSWFDEIEPTLPQTPTPEAAASPAVEAMPLADTAEPLREAIAEPQPEATPEPPPEPTPEPAPAPPPRPVARPVVAPTNPTTLWAENRMLELMNASRARAGLVPLVMDVVVANTARAHSAAEAQVRYVYHDGPDGLAKTRNIPACGTGWYGENTGKIWNDNVDVLHIEFMAEPWEPINHRTNIMDPAFRRVGVGAVMGPDAMYMTMVFCR
jgi:uncharacterized protein YkwD